MTPDSLSSGALGVPPERTAEETDFVEWYVSAFGYFTHTPVSPERLIAGEILRLRASLAAVSEERDKLLRFSALAIARNPSWMEILIASERVNDA